MGDTGRPDTFRPRLTVRFGITGHRPPRLPSDSHTTIKAQCAEVFAIARNALAALQPAHAALFAPDPSEVKLVSSLAEGADVLAAEAALDCGVHLAACLPLPPEVYATDFDAEQWRRTQDLIDRSDTVMVLTDDGGHKAQAYEMAGRLVLSQSDILIAVWDGAEARGRGGTTQIIAEAVARHQPVIHIDSTGARPPELLWSGLHEAIPDRPSLDAIERADARRALPMLIEALCAPPQGAEHEALVEFTTRKLRPAGRRYGWPLLLALTGAKAPTRISFRPPEPAECAERLRAYTRPFLDNGAFGARLNGILPDRFGRADAGANYFALRFRSGFVTNFALAGLAVLLALSGLLFPEAKKVLIGLELLVIALIIANTRGANRRNLHQSWLDRRHLTERLRLLAMTATLGRLSLREVEDGTTHPGWVSWYARATARELGLTSATFDQPYLARVRTTMLALIAEQIDYHAANAHAMHHANHRLHRAGDLLFSGTILACGLYLGAALVFGKPGHIAGIGMTELVTFVTALFPALAAALYGIRMQGDFAATAERSGVIARQLGKLKTAIEGDPLRYERLVDRSRRLSEIMLAEVQQWRLHYETRPMTLPG